MWSEWWLRLTISEEIKDWYKLVKMLLRHLLFRVLNLTSKDLKKLHNSKTWSSFSLKWTLKSPVMIGLEIMFGSLTKSPLGERCNVISCLSDSFNITPAISQCCSSDKTSTPREQNSILFLIKIPTRPNRHTKPRSNSKIF